MMNNNIAVILGHPDSESFCSALSHSYIKGVEEGGGTVRALRLGELEFDPVLRNGYRVRQPLEPDLLRAKELIEWANHLVFIYPNWWGALPALLKGFFDRLFLPGFAYRYHADTSKIDRLLAGRTATLIVTMDTPRWYYRWIYRQPGHRQMKQTILGFCGIKVTRIVELTPIITSTEKQRSEWLDRVKRLGQKRG